MPKRTDLKKILVLGSGPIVIGQACEFDYSGTQAIKALREEGYRVVLVNSNPATIMTDPELSERVYLEPLTVEYLERIIAIERPDALLPTMGGQTALNLTMQLHHAGVLQRYGVEILGASPEVIHRAEDRDAFRSVMDRIGVESAKSAIARSREEGEKILETMGLPLILRPSFTLGGEGGGAVYTREEFLTKLDRALFLSPTKSCLVEENLAGWKEFELEVVRDKKDNVVIVCSIENFDPMGVHTGDSITVAPAQTLTDRQYQDLRDQAIRIIRAIGVETGGSNIQFSINPKDGRVIVIEMNPRVSRSSALASKATGFPIARVAAKLAVGYTLDELTNDITQTTPCSFEPSIDYVVTKIPRFDFEKFKPTETTLGTQMKSVGEVMAMGRTFEESLGKAMVGLETGTSWFPNYTQEKGPIRELLDRPNPARLGAIGDAFRKGVTLDEMFERTFIDRWFLRKIQKMVQFENNLGADLNEVTPEDLRRAKEIGFSDRALTQIFKVTEEAVREKRETFGIFPAFHQVDTCAAEFEAKTPYLYSSYRGRDESVISPRPKVMILGGGPNRIGQGIEFDYCCVHAAMELRRLGYETIMVNCNPETVSTDFDISDKLYFEPLTPEHVLNIARREKPIGVVVQFGGQTPLKIAKALEEAGLPILGTTTDSIDTAEDRERCEVLLKELKPLLLEQPPAATARTPAEALLKARELGFPVLVRPSYVLGGRGMHIVRTEAQLMAVIDEAIQFSETRPVLIDRFLDSAIEVDVDALSDGKDTVIGAILEHIEEAGIHSGDSSCSLPPMSLPVSITDRIRTYTKEIARRLKVVGLLNLQFAIQDNQIFILEINPRASRTVPFVSKATGFPLAKMAIQVMMGRSLADLGIEEDLDTRLKTFNVKAPVFVFHKFPGVDILLGPEMKSTGEVMGRANTFSGAYAKALDAAGMKLPQEGHVFLSIRDEDKAEILNIVKSLSELGFEISATSGTASFLIRNGIECHSVKKLQEGSPNCVEAIRKREYNLVINTASEPQAIEDSFMIRRATLENKIPYFTVVSAARVMAKAIAQERKGPIEVLPL